VTNFRNFFSTLQEIMSDRSDKPRQDSGKIAKPYLFVLESGHSTMPNPSTFQFRTTSWNLVLAASGQPTAESHQALAALCETYWNPVYMFIRRSGYDADQSQDLAQGFFALLIEKNYVNAADREKGRFRSFLLTALRHFLANEWDRANALKRGGGQAVISIDPEDAESRYAPFVVDDTTPEILFQRQWALSLLDRVMGKLQADFIASGKGEHFEIVSSFLNRTSKDSRYETAAAGIGTSAGALRMLVHRARKKYRALLRAEIAETVTTPDEIDDEIRFLLSTLSS
jgi:DNA-directed RNA polymerase specialized sigma24 family protein